MKITEKTMKRIRKQLGWQQHEMAQEMGYKNRETINRKENGKAPITGRDKSILSKLQLLIDKYPIAYVVYEKGVRGVGMWKIPKCPLCGKIHRHSAGGEPDHKPEDYLGFRVPHCCPSPDIKEYRLVLKN
jgi:hypothetical protein